MGCMHFFISECQKTPVVRHKSVRAVSSVRNAFAELRNLTDGSLAQHPSRRRTFLRPLQMHSRPVVISMTTSMKIQDDQISAERVDPFGPLQVVNCRRSAFFRAPP